MDSITDLAEKLADSIRRSVAVDDPDLRLLGSSKHFGDADPLRLVSLANRRIEGRVRKATFDAGFSHWRDPRRGRALGFEGHEYDRMAFPLRSRYGFLGVMWVILTDEEDLPDEDMENCLAVAREMERLLAQQEQEKLDSSREIETHLFALLSHDDKDRNVAVRYLQDQGPFESSAQVTALVIIPDEFAPTPLTDEPSGILRRAMKQAITTQWGQSAASAATDNQGFLLIGDPGNTPNSKYVKFAERLRAEIDQLDPALNKAMRIGIGSSVEIKEASLSYDRAKIAAKISRDTRQHIVAWENQPLEALFEAVLKPTIEKSEIPQVLLETIQAQSEEHLQTLTCFLREAGNVARASEILHLHRTTVYYRLKQFERETQLSLDDGDTRLLLHLWLKIQGRLTTQ